MRKTDSHCPQTTHDRPSIECKSIQLGLGRKKTDVTKGEVGQGMRWKGRGCTTRSGWGGGWRNSTKRLMSVANAAGGGQLGKGCS